jgi:hypothetical protein
MSKQNEEHPFYGKPVLRHREEDVVRSILAKYKNDPVDESLKERIWNDLQMAKYAGEITIPFKVVLRRDVFAEYPEYVEVILDTKL